MIQCVIITRMTKLLVLFLFASLAGCASARFAKHWNDIQPGVPVDQVVKLLGAPRWQNNTPDGGTVLTWSPEDFTECYVSLAPNQAVSSKDCAVDHVAQERYQARQAAMAAAYLGMQQRQSTLDYRPAAYQPQRQTQTNCQTRWSGGTAYTDCSSQPTGIDASIYNR